MSALEGICLAVLTLMSCLASYSLGQRNILMRIKRINEKRRRRAEWEDFDE
jgi:hypothetical protein